MATDGPNLGQIEYEAQGAVWYSALKEFLRAADGLVMPAVQDKDLTTPPSTPTNGDRYIVASTATGAWATHEGKIARYNGSDTTAGWEFYTPKEGWSVYARDENAWYLYNGSAWVAESALVPDGSLSLAKIADQSSGIIVGRTATGTGPVSALSATAVLTLIGAATVAEAKSEILEYALSDEATALTAATSVLTVRVPFGCTLTAVRASLSVTSSSGLVTVDINEAGTTILSTKLSIDASEKTSTTAATAAVISDAALADDAELTFDIDAAGTGAKGLKVKLYVTRT
jgi:hypothetical protein